MISLKDNRTALINLDGTIIAIETLAKLIDEYNDGKPSPAYLTCEYVGDVRIQIDRGIMVTALEAQRKRLVSYLATLGIDATN